MREKVFETRILYGKTFLDFVDENMTLPEEIRDVAVRMNAHVPFGIKFRQNGPIIRVLQSEIVNHCCHFDDDSSIFIFSLNFRGTEK